MKKWMDGFVGRWVGLSVCVCGGVEQKGFVWRSVNVMWMNSGVLVFESIGERKKRRSNKMMLECLFVSNDSHKRRKIEGKREE